MATLKETTQTHLPILLPLVPLWFSQNCCTELYLQSHVHYPVEIVYRIFKNNSDFVLNTNYIAQPLRRYEASLQKFFPIFRACILGDLPINQKQ